MAHPIVPRRLWYIDESGKTSIDQPALITRRESLIILGEPGLGKTKLLRWLGGQPHHAYCTARQLKNYRPGAQQLLGEATTLVVDGLDELGARGEGDTVDLVLQKLGDAGLPRFILSCRSADWRNATAVSAIHEQYGDIGLLVLHLEPLTNGEVRELLRAELNDDVALADGVIAHFTNAQLGGLLGNPQTLELVARVAKAGQLPETKGQLFDTAVELLRREHRDSKADQQPDETTALDAAGAAFAALVLTGSEALVVETADPMDGEIRLGEIAALPGADKIAVVLGSRLFGTAGGTNRYSYWHRRIGEYLGSRWLARQADTAMKRKRILALLQSTGVVPASLRGLHAWLAYHDAALASAVIDTDPMGVIEYGDADDLKEGQAPLLLAALKKAAAQDPRFREWKEYSLRSVTQLPLLSEVRTLINDPNAELGLQLLLIEAVKNSPVAEPLRPDLRRILLSVDAPLARRSRAVDVLVALGNEDWPAVIESLQEYNGDDDIQIALKIVHAVGFKPFSDPSIISLVATQAQREQRITGRLSGVLDALPNERLDGLLDELAHEVAVLGNRHERPGNNEVTDLGYELIGRRLAAGTVKAARLWTWLQPFDAQFGFRRDTRSKVHDQIHGNEQLRRAVQRLVLLDEPGSKSVWERAWRLKSRSVGFALTAADVIVLLNALDPADHDDEKMKDLLLQTQHSAAEGAQVREVAKRRVAERPDMLHWIEQLAVPSVPEWEIEQEAALSRREAERAIRWQHNRTHYAAQINAMRDGKYSGVVDPARVYLSLCYDMNDEAAPPDRLSDWLGVELAEAAIEGFERYIQSNEPPTANEIAESRAQSRSWNATAIIVAALAERIRNGSGFAGVSDDRLTAGFYELRHTRVDQHARLEALKPALEEEMRARDLIETALVRSIKPQIEHRCAHIHELHELPGDVGSERAADLSADWLRHFRDIAVEPEAAMIDQLITSRRFDILRDISLSRVTESLSEDRQRNWNAVAFLTGFEQERDRLVAVAAADPNWIWSVRQRIASEWGRIIAAELSIEQLAWLMKTFRSTFPNVHPPSGGTFGNANPWDATQFLAAVVSRLADQTSDKAIAALSELRDAPTDSYTPFLRAVTAEQRRKHAEQRYQPPLLADLRAVTEAQPPRTIDDFKATLLELLDQVQKRIRADPADPWRGFYTDCDAPHNEERCRDHILTMLGVRPESIDLTPEGHLADDNRADIIGTVSGMRIPVEIKGQWHPELWQAADTQLDRLYATDYSALRRGIYLVLWFGENVPSHKRLKVQARGCKRPQTPCELRARLIAASEAAKDGRAAVLVLDLERPPRT